MSKTPSKTLAKPAASAPTVQKGSGASQASSEPIKAEAPKKRTNIFVFFREVRQEARKITWTSRKETWITSVMVLIMVILATVFFGLVDFAFGALAALVLKG